MKGLLLLAATALLSAPAQASPLQDSEVVRDIVLNELITRALPANAPHGYAPQTGDCPSTKPQIRAGDALSQQETDWLKKRRDATIGPMQDLLKRVNIQGLDTDKYINDHKSNVSSLPNIGIAVSGGGYRAMLNDAGYLQAWDNRTPNSTSSGQLGGLLQATTYLSGLSGGSWLVGSLYTNNFTSISNILSQDTSADDSGSLWQFENSIFKGPKTGKIQILDSAGYYKDLIDSVDEKKDAGWNASITDYWGRALSYQLVNATNGGPAYTWSSLADQDFFTSGSVPLPMIVADSRLPNETAVPSNTTIFTFDPWELGTFDPTVNAFAPLKYIGSNFSNGQIVQNGKCTTGFDNVGFVYGTSSTLFNQLLLRLGKMSGGFPSSLVDIVQNLAQGLSDDQQDIADWPNPFWGYHNDTNNLARSGQLTLVDGGEDGQNIPLHPLIQPYRHVDIIFAVDSSADTKAGTDDAVGKPTNNSAGNWPDGASLQATYRRSLSSIQNGTPFPSIPSINTFLNKGLNNRPTFFGCDAKNITGDAPLIVYLPNAPYVFDSNSSTYKMSYTDDERNAMILNAYNGATQGNGTLDSNWGACVGCAILSRSFDRTGTQVPAACKQCFTKYCWDGSTDEKAPSSYNPTLKIQNKEVKPDEKSSDAGTVKASLFAATLAAAMSVLLV